VVHSNCMVDELEQRRPTAEAGEPQTEGPRAGGSLKGKVLRGSVWLVSGDAAGKVANVAKLAVLVRFLNPMDFGLMGMALVVLRWINAFTETGFKDALIRKEGDIRPFLNTSWTIQILRGALTGGVLCLCAPWVAGFFESPALTDILRAIALIPLVNGFRNPAVITLRKRLDLRGDVVLKLGGVMVGFLVAVPLAFALRSVWALVFSAIAAAVAEVMFSYWVLPYRPWPQLNWSQAREMGQFGRWVMFSNISAFLFLTLDGLLIGKLLGAEALGVYQLGYQLAVMPMVQLGVLSNSVMFPTFSTLRHPREARRTFLKFMGLSWSVLLPACCFLAVCADPVVWLLFGSKWNAVAPVVQILAWGGAALALTVLGNSFFLGTGRPHLVTHVSASRLSLLLVSIYPCVKYYGLHGAALAVAVAAGGAALYQFVLTMKLVGPTLQEAAEMVRVGLLGSVLFGLATVVVRPAPSLPFLGLISLAVMVYLLFLVRLVQSHFGPLGNFAWPRSLRETLTF